MPALRSLHAIVKERQADWHRDAAEDRRRDAMGGEHPTSAAPDPAARRLALLFHGLRRTDTGRVRP